jgi:hypothetical protein
VICKPGRGYLGLKWIFDHHDDLGVNQELTPAESLKEIGRVVVPDGSGAEGIAAL